MSGNIAILDFQKTVLQFYHQQSRDLPWRYPEKDGTFDPYKILVSEMMLQQTQVNRVIPKYQDFINRFSDLSALANASLADVLTFWSGLGYNRRASYLYKSAQQIQLIGQFPRNIKKLIELPGIGINTAGAVIAYAFNQPIVFIETNIRTVFIHHFFLEQETVADSELLPLVTQTLDHNNPREWYWALMDYGTFLKQQHGNLSRRSTHYVKQSGFQGSRRQVRGQVLKKLIDNHCTHNELAQDIPDTRLSAVLTELINEGLISKAGQTYQLGK